MSTVAKLYERPSQLDVRPEDLTAREVKVLRFVVTSGWAPARRCVVRSAWSDLPQSVLQATCALGRLRTIGLISRKDRGFEATSAGERLIADADRRKIGTTTD